MDSSCLKVIHKIPTSHDLLPASGCVWQKYQPKLFLDTQSSGGPLGYFGLSISSNLFRSECPLRHHPSLPLPAFLSPSFRARPVLWSDGSLSLLQFTHWLPKHISSISNPVLISFNILANTLIFSQQHLHTSAELASAVHLRKFSLCLDSKNGRGELYLSWTQGRILCLSQYFCCYDSLSDISKEERYRAVDTTQWVRVLATQQEDPNLGPQH